MDWRFLLRVTDLFAVAVAIPFTFWLSTYIDPVPTPDPNRITVLNCIFFWGIVLLLFHRHGMYRWVVFVRIWPLVKRLAAVILFSAWVYIVIRFFVAPFHHFTYLPFFFFYCVVCFVVVFFMRLLARLLVVRIFKSVRIERIAFVGWSTRLSKVVRGIAAEMGEFHRMEGYFLDPSRPRQVPPGDSGYSQIGSLDDFKNLLQTRRISMLLVDQGHVSGVDLRAISDLCADAMVNLRMIPATFDVWADRLTVRVVSGIPLLGINDLHHDHFGNRILKRSVDIAGALVGLALSAPIIAVLALLIRRESPGPIFFRQVRLGLRGKPFEIIKLRSMRVDAEASKGAVWAVENDPRRTKIGEFMRKWNLDELPQFWNVLHGEMSLVGPRPERPEFVSGFRDSVRYYNLRHTCKPGVTGWAAVHGLRGNTSLEDRLDYDLYYIENWSLFLDFKIMLMTLAPPKNAY